MANTIREKELKTKWDALTASDPTKYIGHKKSLSPVEGSSIEEKEKVGMS
jgi:hypothetical protein